MTTEQAEESVGRPDDRDVHVLASGFGSDEFWHYDGGMLHFRNGRLVGWSSDGSMADR